ncbi:kinase-like domain-containing protein, partial [Roridomyces roridus]
MSPSASYLLPDLTGEFVDDGCIELLSLIGSGAYGKVYKAFDHYDEQHYAVKCMPRYPVGSRGAQIQQAELTIHGSISGHPRVIALHHHFVTDNYVFAVLELAEGGDFFTALVDKKLYSGDTELIKRVFGELLDAVDYIHRNSVYHRDIKPENFLCDADGLNIRLADFGLATRIPLSREFGCGTRSYMTPESINEDDSYDVYSARHSDVWALAIIFTNIISGHVPWNSAELSDPGFRAFRSNPEYLYKALRLSRPAYLLLQQCFDMNPLRRPTIAELRMAINEMDSF